MQTDDPQPAVEGTRTTAYSWTAPARILKRLDARLSRRASCIAALFTVMALAGAMRVIYFLQVSQTLRFARPLVDSQYYDRAARDLLAGAWPGDGVFFVDPLYTYILAAHYSVFGSAASGVIAAQMVLGVTTVGLLFLFARLTLRPTGALVAGLLAACYPVTMFFEGILLKTSASVFALVALFYLLARARRGPSGWSFAAGLTLGAAALLRGNLLLLAPAAFAWLLWTTRSWTRAGILTAGALIAILPVTAHNIRAGDWVLTTSNAGQNLYTGNGVHNVTGTYQPPPGVRAQPTFEERDFARIATEAVGHALRPSEVSSYWLGRTVEEASADPGRIARHLGRKFLLFVNSIEIPDNESYARTRDVVPLLRWPLPCFGLLIILASAAVVLTRWTPERVLVVAVVAIVGMTVVAFFVNARFRLTAVPGLLILAGALPCALAESMARGRWLRIGAALAVGLGALFLVTRPGYTAATSMSSYNDAVIALEDGDRAGALAHLDLALAEEAGNWNAHLLAGDIHAVAGRDDDAEAAFRAAIQLAPAAPEPQFALGRFLAERGRLPEAAEAFTRAGTDRTAVSRLADVERRMGKHPAARQRLKAWLAKKPRQRHAWHVLGLVEMDAGNLEQAESALRQAVLGKSEVLAYRLSLALCLRRAGKLDEAQKLYRAILSAHPGNVEAARGAQSR